MKRTLLSALTILVASAAIAPIASAVEPTSFNIQATRLEELDRRSKNQIHKIRLEHLNNQSKAIEDIQATRLNELDRRSKNTVHKLRLEHLNNQSKAIEDIQATRLNELDRRSKTVNLLQEARLDALEEARTNTTVENKIQVQYLNNQTQPIR